MGRVDMNSIQGLNFTEVNSDVLLDETRRIFREYQESIDTDLCFQKFEEELASLPGKYAPPKGRLYLCFMGEQLVGCVALRPINDSDCEMKRLYVKPEFRGRGLGRVLAEKIITESKKIGYKEIFLDTLTSMKSAINLYKSLGFKKSEPYCFNPENDAVFMSLIL